MGTSHGRIVKAGRSYSTSRSARIRTSTLGSIQSSCSTPFVITCTASSHTSPAVAWPVIVSA